MKQSHLFWSDFYKQSKASQIASPNYGLGCLSTYCNMNAINCGKWMARGSLRKQMIKLEIIGWWINTLQPSMCLSMLWLNKHVLEISCVTKGFRCSLLHWWFKSSNAPSSVCVVRLQHKIRYVINARDTHPPFASARGQCYVSQHLLLLRNIKVSLPWSISSLIDCWHWFPKKCLLTLWICGFDCLRSFKFQYLKSHALSPVSQLLLARAFLNLAIEVWYFR